MRDSEEDYQAEFSALESRSPAIGGSPEITLLYKPYDEDPDEDSLSSVESEAYAIAEYIQNAAGRLEVHAGGETRTANYDDFALLFRSGTNQKTYEQVFRAKGIPCTVHSVRTLFQEAPVNDIYNLLQICLYPEDRLASAALLRSPLMNLSDLSVVRFMLSGKAVFADEQEDCCETAKDRIKYLKARLLYEEVLSLIDRKPIAEIVSLVWFKSGYRYLILHDSSLHGYLEYYDYIHELAAGFDRRSGSMVDFLDKVRENLGDYKKLDELKILGYSSAGVKIMPVHQSKGLEFPVVIIANAGNRGVSDRGGSAPAFISETDGLSFNLVNSEQGAASRRCNYFYSRGKEENLAKEDAELRRLFYVALTRAETHLVISGCHGKNNRNDEKSMLNLLLSAFGSSGGLEPGRCPEADDYLKMIRDMKWEDRETAGRHTADTGLVLSTYKKLTPVEYVFEKNIFSATELNAEYLETAGLNEGEQLPVCLLLLKTFWQKKTWKLNSGPSVTR